GERAEDVGGVAVPPLLAGLRREGQRREPLHRWAERLILGGGIPPPPGGGSEPFGGVQRRDEPVGAVRDAGRVGEQIPDRDGTGRRLDDEAGVALGRDGGVRKGRDEATHRVAQRDL